MPKSYPISDAVLEGGQLTMRCYLEQGLSGYRYFPQLIPGRGEMGPI